MARWVRAMLALPDDIRKNGHTVIRVAVRTPIVLDIGMLCTRWIASCDLNPYDSVVMVAVLDCVMMLLAEFTATTRME